MMLARHKHIEMRKNVKTSFMVTTKTIKTMEQGAGVFQKFYTHSSIKLSTSVADPDLNPYPDSHVFGPPGSGSGSIS
jgi:hypothetical protein